VKPPPTGPTVPGRRCRRSPACSTSRNEARTLTIAGEYGAAISNRMEVLDKGRRPRARPATRAVARPAPRPPCRPRSTPTASLQQCGQLARARARREPACKPTSRSDSCWSFKPRSRPNTCSDRSTPTHSDPGARRLPRQAALRARGGDPVPAATGETRRQPRPAAGREGESRPRRRPRPSRRPPKPASRGRREAATSSSARFLPFPRKRKTRDGPPTRSVTNGISKLQARPAARGWSSTGPPAPPSASAYKHVSPRDTRDVRAARACPASCSQLRDRHRRDDLSARAGLDHVPATTVGLNYTAIRQSSTWAPPTPP